MKKHLLSLILTFLLFSSTISYALATHSIIFKLNVDQSVFNEKIKSVSIRGNTKPLDWEKPQYLSMNDEGLFTIQLDFQDIKVNEVIQYKYVINDEIWELQKESNRILLLNNSTKEVFDLWNDPNSSTSSDSKLMTLAQDGLLEDYSIMKRAYQTFHPGLYRYTDSVEMEKYWGELKDRLMNSSNRRDAYKAFSKLLAHIQCGHTYCNFYNQPDITKYELFQRTNRLPFSFRIINKQLVITGNASENVEIVPGTEIISINQVPVSVILDSLMTVVKSDGNNDGKRYETLEVTGYDKYEAFDIYYPLFFDTDNANFLLDVKLPNSQSSTSVKVEGISTSKRKKVLQSRYGGVPENYDEYWKFNIPDQQYAILTIGTFATYKIKLDWKKFLDNAFSQLRKEDIPNLVIDIRGNEGGMNDVVGELLMHLLKKDIELDPVIEKLRYEKISADLDPYLDTWDNSFKDRSGKVIPIGDGFYTWKNAPKSGMKISAGKNPYNGKVFLLINAGNSSATFTLAKIIKKQKLATLIGQETGGNKNGINGGQMFFLTLPNSSIEMDIPLIGYYAVKKQPDEGIKPDISVEPSIDDIANGIDRELQTAIEIIQQGQ